MRLLAASANIEYRLPAAAARAAVDNVLAERPDIVGLQEFFLTRARLLGSYGTVRLTPGPLRLGEGGPGTYTWSGVTFGDCVVGLRADRFAVEGVQVLRLSRLGRADNPKRPWGIEPPRRAVLVRCRERRTAIPLSIVSFHLVPGVQRKGEYRADRPELVARHHDEAGRLDAVVARELGLGRVVLAMGDSNFDGFAVPGLTSAWSGRPAPGTHGSRSIDDIFGPGRPEEVWTLENASDHRAVFAVRTIAT